MFIQLFPEGNQHRGARFLVEPAILQVMNTDEKLDACGLSCPLPLLKAKQALNRLDAGLVLEVICTDPGSVRDFEVFAKQSGNELLHQEESAGTYTHWLKKA